MNAADRFFAKVQLDASGYRAERAAYSRAYHAEHRDEAVAKMRARRRPAA